MIFSSKLIKNTLKTICLISIFFILCFLKAPVNCICLASIFFIVYIIGIRLNNITINNWAILNGKNLFLTFWFVSVFISWIGTYVFIYNDIWISRFSNIDFTKAFLLNIFGMMVFLTSYYIFSQLAKLALKGKRDRLLSKPNVKVIYDVSFIFIVCGIILIFLWLKQMGSFTALINDATRFQVINEENFSWFGRVIYGIPIAIILLLQNEWGRWRIKTIIIVSLAMLLLILFGSKMLFVYPLIILTMNFNLLKRKIKFNPKLCSVAVIIVILLVFYTNYRGLSRPISNDVVSDFFIVIFPEFRGRLKP